MCLGFKRLEIVGLRSADACETGIVAGFDLTESFPVDDCLPAASCFAPRAGLLGK